MDVASGSTDDAACEFVGLTIQCVIHGWYISQLPLYAINVAGKSHSLVYT